MNYMQRTKGRETDNEVKVQPDVLPVTKLRFTGSQLNNLNYIFGKKMSHFDQKQQIDEMSKKTVDIVERLIQRLLSAVGSYDSRFSSSFLVTLHDSDTKRVQSSLDYIVRLDTLSTPAIFESDDNPKLEILECRSDSPNSGFAKIRLRSATAKAWAEFVNSSGYLRRDKIQERYVELLAHAAASATPVTALEVDESSCCGLPGKIVDASTLYDILQLSPEERLFFGPASNNLRFPEPRDFRLAIIDETTCIKVRVGFLAQSFGRRDVEVTLRMAVAVDFWPQNTDFPHRVTLDHTDVLLYYQAAQKGVYLVSDSSQNTNWRLMFPASEVALLNHYDHDSTVAKVLQILYIILEEIHCNVTEEKCKFSQKLLTRRAIREVFWGYLEEDCSFPLLVLQSWTASHISKHVLKVTDKIIGHLRQLKLPSYFFPTCNLLPEPSYIYEEDYLIEANRLHLYVARMFDESIRPVPDDDDQKKLQAYEKMDASLVTKWRDFVDNMAPPKSTRSNRFSFSGNSTKLESYTHYTQRQIDYVGLLLKNILLVKQKSVQIPDDFGAEAIHCFQETPKEDIIYLLVVMIQQAKEHNTFKKSSRSSKIRNKIDAATAKLVESMRKDKPLSSLDLSDDAVLVKTVLKWLYKGQDQSRNYLGLVLRPYLNKLFRSSHENSWHLEAMRRSEVEDELQSLGIFCRLVNASTMTPAAALIEAVNKNWNWAKNILDFVQKSYLRIVLTSSRKFSNRHILSLPSYGDKSKIQDLEREFDRKMHTLQERRKMKDMKSTTLPARKFLRYFENSSEILGKREENSFSHGDLKYGSCLTELFRNKHRFGLHRCPGDLMKSLISLQKISILQEITYYLPPEERQAMLNEIQRISKETKRQFVKRRYTLPPLRNQSRKSAASRRNSFSQQSYRPTSEDAFASTERLDSSENNSKWTLNKQGNLIRLERMTPCKSLLEACRSARMREDSRVIVHENIKVKSLFTFDDVN